MTARQRIQDWFEKEKASNIADGRAEGQRRLVEKQLRLKFGVLSEPALARIAAATSTQLDLWAERVLSAASLDEVWQ